VDQHKLVIFFGGQPQYVLYVLHLHPGDGLVPEVVSVGSWPFLPFVISPTHAGFFACNLQLPPAMAGCWVLALCADTNFLSLVPGLILGISLFKGLLIATSNTDYSRNLGTPRRASKHCFWAATLLESWHFRCRDQGENAATPYDSYNQM